MRHAMSLLGDDERLRTVDVLNRERTLAPHLLRAAASIGKRVDTRALVWVLGAHRSGTSAVAGALHHAGVTMGTERYFVPRPMPQNPRGFFEDVRFRAINDRLLARRGYLVRRWDALDGTAETTRTDRLMMRSAIRARSVEGVWGWKDPRQCLTAVTWHDVLGAMGSALPLAVIVYRRPDDVARSLIARGDVESLDQGRSVWLDHNKAILDYLARRSPRHVAVSYEEMLADPRAACERIVSCVGTPLDVARATSWLDPDLAQLGPRGAGDMAGEYGDVYAALEALSRGGPDR